MAVHERAMCRYKIRIPRIKIWRVLHFVRNIKYVRESDKIVYDCRRFSRRETQNRNYCIFFILAKCVFACIGSIRSCVFVHTLCCFIAHTNCQLKNVEPQRDGIVQAVPFQLT